MVAAGKLAAGESRVALDNKKEAHGSRQRND